MLGLAHWGQSMNWLQFIDSMVGHLAWPVVVGALLFFLRRQLTGLAFRLKELSLPGGMKATFEKELEVGRTIVEQIPAPTSPPQLAPSTPEEESTLYRLAIESPDGAIVLAYLELEKALRDIAVKLGMGSKVTNQRSVMEEVVKRNVLSRARPGFLTPYGAHETAQPMAQATSESLARMLSNTLVK